MNQNISALMDGELCEDEADLLLARFRRHTEAQNEWKTYHLIGDVLRQPEYIHDELSKSFFDRLHAEPTILAPSRKRTSQIRSFAMTAAASIMAVVMLAWMSVRIDAEPSYQQARAAPVNLRNVGLPVNEAMNEYLLAHHEYSPSTDVRGAASYIRTVAFKQTVAGK